MSLSYRNRTVWRVAFFILAANLINVPCARGDQKIFIQGGFNMFHRSTIDKNDFSGEFFFETEKELILIPKIKGAQGFEGGLGARYDFSLSFLKGFSFDIYYSTSKHKYAFMDAESETTTATSSNVLFNFKFHLVKFAIFQPYVYLEMGRFNHKFRDASFSYIPPIRSGEAQYYGSELGGGLGMEFHFLIGAALVASAGYHYFEFMNVKGISGEKHEIEKLKGSYPRFTVGLVLRVLIKKFSKS